MNAKDETKQEVLKPSTDLEFIMKVALGYVQLLEMTYGFIREEGKQALHFTELGKMKCLAVFGYITALWEAGHHHAAETLTKEFMQQLGYLGAYGGTRDHPLQPLRQETEPRKMPIPVYYVELGDDGTRHGFTVLWYKYIGSTLPADYRERSQSYRVAKFGSDQFFHRFAMNGGLIYHGPGGDAFTVNLGTQLWGIHT